MSGKYCTLEPFDLQSHHADLYDAFSADKDTSNWTYLPYGPFDTLNAFKQWCDSECMGDDPLFHTIINRKTGKPSGVASYLRISPDTGSIEVGHIHFSPELQGTRMATESMFLMMQRAFEELGYRRYEWKCNALNAPSCRAAERFGFTFEGIFRQAAMTKGQNRDTAWFSIIDEEWPRLLHGYDRWLGEENFDSNGQQILGLTDCFDL